ncbi:CobW family GTP-binding protein [Robertmurraya sp. GLU-23]
MKQTEIYILSGFLGSGKTTLLKKLLQAEKERGRKVAVLMNELGKVSIDSDEVSDDVPLKELLGGCICCTIQDKLEAQLQELLMTHQPDCIYIETTGAAHPVETLDAVLSPLFATQLHVKGILTVVDGRLWLERRSFSPQIQQLVTEQIRHADLIVVNKTDELSEGEKVIITTGIQSLNEKANVILTTYSSVSMNQIQSLAYQKKPHLNKSHVENDLKLSTFVYSFSKAVDMDGFESFLQELPDTIYRIKGYVKFSSTSFPYLFQFSYGMPIYIKEEMNMPLNLVFIGENILWDEISKKLQQLEEQYLK